MISVPVQGNRGSISFSCVCVHEHDHLASWMFRSMPLNSSVFSFFPDFEDELYPFSK